MKGQWLRKPTNDTSVVFIHGFLSSTQGAWQNNNGLSWPSILQKEPDFPGIGIYLFDYYTSPFSGTYGVSAIVDAFRIQARHDGLYKCKRLIFVCHSMGGIVARKFVVDRQLDMYRARIKIGIFLVASPSSGASYATFFSAAATHLHNAQLDQLRFSQDNYWLNDLDGRFRDLYLQRMSANAEEEAIDISGQELLEDKFIVFKKWFFFEQVVPPFAGATYFPQPVRIPKSDHMSIAKPEDGSAMQHTILRQFIQDHIQVRASSLPSDIDALKDEVIVKVVTDTTDADLVLALHLYEDRIPEPERFESSDIVRWIQEDIEARKAGRIGPRDYFLIGKYKNVISGCALLHYYPQTRFAFFAYLVTARGLDTEFISQRLARKLREIFTTDDELKHSTSILLEIDDPRRGGNEEERRERLARLRLFDTIASAMHFGLRVISFPYKQPYVSIAEAEANKGNVQMLLVEVSPRSSAYSTPRFLNREQMRDRLEFIYLSLYPEGFSDQPEENVVYRKYLAEFCRLELSTVDAETRLLSVREFRALV